MIPIMDGLAIGRFLRMNWPLLYILFGVWHSTAALTVDNQLVSARNDCFERIALEAMLPFEKTFRTEDTNSLKTCKEKCLQTGERCQAISFGVHRRGNGTCQLSSEQYGSDGGGRPGGVIFDPDFDLYTRKTNCFDLSDNSIPPGPGLSPISHGPTPANLPNRPLDLGNTPVLVVNPTPPTDEPPLRLPTISTPSVGPGPSPSLPPPPGLGDRLYFSHDLYPLYKYPALYENNYPAPNEDVYIPGGYAANAPEVEDHYHRPHYGPLSLDEEAVRPTPHGAPRPIFGLGYGNGYSYGSPERYTPPTMRPPSASSDERPHYAARPPPPDYPPPPLRPYDSSTPPSYGPRPSPSYEHHREPRPDYTNRPDPPLQSPQGGDEYVRRNGSAMRPVGAYGGYSVDDDKTIATYFNPGDYMQGNGNNKRPMGDRNRDRDRDSLGYPMDELKKTNPVPARTYPSN